MSATSRGNARAVLTTSLVKASSADAAKTLGRESGRETPNAAASCRRRAAASASSADEGPVGSASAGSGRASSGRRGRDCTRIGRRAAGGGAALAAPAIALHRNPPPGSTPPAGPPPAPPEEGRDGNAADPDLGVRAGGGATASGAVPSPSAGNASASALSSRCDASSHCHPSSVALPASARPRMPWSSSTIASAPSRVTAAPAGPRLRSSFASPPFRVSVSPARSRRRSAPLARVAASRARLARRSMNILAASSDWSCSMRLAAASAVSFSRAARASAAFARSAAASRNARYTLNFPSPHLSRCASRRWQSRAVIGTRFSGFSNCFARVTYSARTAASNRCAASTSVRGSFRFSVVVAVVSASARASSNGGCSSSLNGSSVIGSHAVLVFHQRSERRIELVVGFFLPSVGAPSVLCFFPRLREAFLDAGVASDGPVDSAGPARAPPRPAAASGAGARGASRAGWLAALVGGSDRGKNGELVARNAVSSLVGGAIGGGGAVGTVPSPRPRPRPLPRPRPRDRPRPRPPDLPGPPDGVTSPDILAPRRRARSCHFDVVQKPAVRFACSRETTTVAARTSWPGRPGSKSSLGPDVSFRAGLAWRERSGRGGELREVINHVFCD